MPAGAGRREGGGRGSTSGSWKAAKWSRGGAGRRGHDQSPADRRHPHTHLAMETLTVKDIPREMLIKDSLKGELLGDRKLRPTEAAEKNVLPSAEDVQTEKKHQSILNGK